MSVELGRFLRADAELPPYPGGCSKLVDKWICQRTGFSALARFGRGFSTQEEVDAWLAEPGGIAVAVNRVMRAGGFPKTKAPDTGDVGLVFNGRGRTLAMAIHASTLWVGRDDNGHVGYPLGNVWKAWRLTPEEGKTTPS